jgi:hypothetical protein
MSPADVQAYVEELAAWGIRYLEDGEALDLVVVDQLRGPVARCAWAEFAIVTIGDEQRERISACRLRGDEGDQIYTPERWEYEGSLSQQFLFVPLGAEHSLEKIGEVDGMDVMRSALNDKPMYVARTHRS